MARKRKLTNQLPVKETELKIDLTKENVENDKHSVCNQDVNNKNLANICHKKSHGANNWQLFKQSLLNSQNSKTNKANKVVPKEKSKHQKSYSRPTSKDLAQMTSSKKLPLSKCSTNDTSKSVINGKRHLVQKQSFSACQIPERIVLTKCIAMDCEMVGVEIGVNKNMLARISLVNLFGDCVYDKFVKPTEPVLDYRTRVSGVRSTDLENAEDFKIVQKEVADILKGRILVGHALKNDLSVLYLSHPKQNIRDTSRFKKFCEGGTPSLKKLAMKYLGVSIQEGEHSSVQDALAAMQLYRMFKKDWESNLRKPREFKTKKESQNFKLMEDI